MYYPVSHISGVCEVIPNGRTQPEKKYVLETVLSHLPAVCGPDDVMCTTVNELPYYQSFSNCDEFYNKSNLARTLPSYNPDHENCFTVNEFYSVTLNANLDFVDFNSALKMFMKWIIRFSKRILVYSALVRISNEIEDKDFIFDSSNYDLHLSDPYWADYILWKFEHDNEGKAILGKPDSH